MSFKERMKVRRNINVEDAHESRRNQGMRTKEKVFSIITNSGHVGKSSGELRHETGLSRDRIHTICKEYMDEGMLYKTGRYGKYLLTQKALGDPARKGRLFGLKIMKDFFSFDYISANSGKFCNTAYIDNIINDIKKRNTKPSINRDPNIKDQLFLFEFAVRIGAIITYEMIRAIKFASDNPEVNEKDQLAWKWIDNVILPQYILASFADTWVVKKNLKHTRLERGPFYDMDKKELEALLQSFQNIFPEVYEKSEDILSGLQSRIDSDREYAKEIFDREKQMQIEDPKHTKCGGQLIPVIKTGLEGIKVQQCSKCHRWIKIRKSKVNSRSKN
jgi:hypothetical protein